MKTFYKIPVILLLLCTAGMLWGQLPDYYSGKSTVTANGNTYKITMDHLLRIQNVNNYKMDHPYDSKGNPVPGYQMSIDRQMKEKVKNLIKKVFNYEELTKITNAEENSMIGFLFIVDDRTGKVLEVLIAFNNNPQTRSITPSKIYELEKGIKQIVIYPHDPGSSREFHTGTAITIGLKDLYDNN